MESPSDYILIFSLITVVVYLIMMLNWNISWNIYSKNNTTAFKQFTTRVTVILPVRNEAKNIHSCLEFLSAQHYPAGMLEILVTDDESTDRTVELVRSFRPALPSSHEVKLISSVNAKTNGKKAAIERAINQAKGEIILTTDADCYAGKNWVNTFVEIYERKNPQMITGFVRISPQQNLFSQLQALEFLSLSGSAAISVIRQKPLMCNGANLAFTKAAFADADGYQYGSSDASGDDTYLMLKIAEKNHSDVAFNNNPESVVTTIPATTPRELVMQRIRWASKVKNYKEGYIKRMGIFIFIVNMVLILLLFMTITKFISWEFTIFTWALKMLADLLIIYPSSDFARQRNLLLLFLPAQIIYPFYAIAGMLLSIGKTGYKWKDRNY